MAVFKCKMCGGTIEFNEGDTVGICDSCGTKQTLPKATDEAVQSLFNRANTLRLKSEFDRAEEMYNKIISVDETQAEAYWGLILCKYGIEYVEDPKTFKRVPTCHRTSFESITADEDFKLAVKYADISQKEIYQQEAKVIDEIQKDILKIAADEKPFDVFLCYKETDESGKRTQDSVIANDIYHQLSQEGYKVFYAAITLEEKLGQEYEPYIFAALNSAKVMLVIGSKPEYFTAVWVKNEWSRFLKLMKNDRSKLLIPCYKDMDAYELPDDFAHLQAQDMSKIGFINDVVRGIKKVVNKEKEAPKVKETVVVNNTQTNANIVALKKRGFMALEDGEWKKADGFFEEALNQDAEDAECYLGKLMVELNVKKSSDIKNCFRVFSQNPNYNKALYFGDASLKSFLTECNKTIIYRNAEQRLNAPIINTEEYNTIKQQLISILPYKNSDELIKLCDNKREILSRNISIYNNAISLKSYKDTSSLKQAAKMLDSLGGFYDSQQKAAECREAINSIEKRQTENIIRFSIIGIFSLIEILFSAIDNLKLVSLALFIPVIIIIGIASKPYKLKLTGKKKPICIYLYFALSLIISLFLSIGMDGFEAFWGIWLIALVICWISYSFIYTIFK